MARKQRLNVRFLLIAGIPVTLVGLVIGLYVFRSPLGRILPPQIRWLYKGTTPAAQSDKAKVLYDKGEYAEAAEGYKSAIVLKGAPDAPLYTALGDCYAHLAVLDDENRGMMFKCWNLALSVDPNFMPALQRVLDYYEALGEINNGAEAAKCWDLAQSTAIKIIALTPTDQHARIAQPRAIIMRWLSGVEINAALIDEAVSTLTKIAQEDPFNAEALVYAMQGRMQRGAERLKNNDRAGATEVFNEVLKTVDDALAAHPDDAMMHYRAAQLLLNLGLAERATASTPTAVNTSSSKYSDRVRAEVEKAASLIKPTDPKYVEVKIWYARIVQLQGDKPGAMKIYRALMEEKPGDISVRLSLAELLGRETATRPEAIQILEKLPPPDPKEASGVKALLSRNQRTNASLELCDLVLDSLGDQKDKASMEAALNRAQEVLATVTANPGLSDHPVVLLARGRIQLYRGNALQAVQTLEQARSLLPPSSGLNEQRVRILGELARAYLVTNQTGLAKDALQELIRINPANTPGRVMLTRLLLSEGNTVEAKKQLDVLASDSNSASLSTEILCLQIAALDKDKDAAKIAELYAKLPETTPQEQVVKSQMASSVGKRDEAVRLLELAHVGVPTDLTLVEALARLYTEASASEKANALIEDAIAKNPNRPELKLLQAEISGAAADITELRRDLIEKITDPIRKELLLYQLAAQEGKNDEALQHLQTAAAQKPDDHRVLDIQFQNAVLQKKWDLASQYVEQLAKQNADLADGLLYRVRLSMARGSLDQAADLAQQLTKKLPQFSQSWVSLGQVQRAQGKYLDASQSFELALKNQPNHLEALRGIIAASYELNQIAVAKSYIDRARKLFPNYQPMRELELQHELKYGNPENTIAARKDMLKEATDAKASSAEARAWLNLGSAYMASARAKSNPQDARPFFEQARETYKQAMAKYPDELGFVQLCAESLLQLKNAADGEKAIRELIARPNWAGKPEPTIILADYLGAAGKQADQEKLLRDYLAGSPTAIAVQLRLSTLLARQGKLDDALKILEANADAPAIRRQRIELQIDGNRLNDAEKEIQTVLASTSNPGPVLLNRQAFVYMKSGRPTQALQVLDKVLSQNPDDAEALFYRGSIYLAARKNLDLVIRDLQQVKDFPGSELTSRMLLAEAHHYAGDDSAAIRELEDAVKLAPTDKTPRLRLVDYYSRSTPPQWSMVERTLREGRSQPQMSNDVDLMRAEAVMWLQRRDTDKAGEVVQQALKTAPNNTELFRTYCDILLQARDYRRLLAGTDPMVKAKTAPWWVYQYRGRADTALKDNQQALIEFTNGMDVASAAKDDAALASILDTIVKEIGVPSAISRVIGLAEKGDNRWRLMMSSLLQTDNDIQGAIDWVQKVINDSSADSTTRATAQQRLAQLYLRLTPPECGKAVAVYRDLLKNDPNDLVALNNLACTMILPNSGYQPKEALTYSEQAFKQVQQSGDVNAYIYDTQGYVLILNGRVQDGITLLRQAIDKEPIPEACYHLGEAYLTLPQPLYSDAEESLKQALGVLDALSKDQKPLDAELKTKIEKALARAHPPGGTTPEAAKQEAAKS